MNGEITIEWDVCKGQQWQTLYAQAMDAAALQQSYAYGEMAKRLNVTLKRAVIFCDAQPVALVQATQKRVFRLFKLSLAMRGPVWLKPLSTDRKQHILRALKASHKGRLLLMPEETDGFAVKGLRRVITGYNTVVIDLRQSEEVLLAAQQGKWRNRLRAAQKSPLRIDKIGQKTENYRWLLDQEVEQSRRKGYAALSPLLVPVYQLQAGKDGVLGVQAWLQNSRVAGMLFLLHGKTATYHIGWSDDAGKKHNAHNALLWEAMLQLKAAGIEWLDLGGVNDRDGEGLTRFKLGTGGEVRTLCGTYL